MVTFIDERKKMRIPQRVKPREAEEPKQKKASFKGAQRLSSDHPSRGASRQTMLCTAWGLCVDLPRCAGTANNMKTGELTHRGPAALDNENFEPVRADTFEGLGIPSILADHLEGEARRFGHVQNSRGPALTACSAAGISKADLTMLYWLAELNFTSPTRVQQQAIPRLLVSPFAGPVAAASWDQDTCLGQRSSPFLCLPC